MILFLPVVASPPACSTRKDMGAASYSRRSFPLGFLAVAAIQYTLFI